MRALGLTPFLLVLLVARPAGAADLCGTLFVPDGYTLLCETRIEDGKRRERMVVRPSGSSIRLRSLSPGRSLSCG